MRRLPAILAALFACILSLFAQEPIEARARRLQANDIPPLIEKADAGDQPSQALLWLAYAHGYGVPKDLKKAVVWLRKLAERDNPEAQFILASLYRDGRGGLPVDHAEAFKWTLKSAEHGHAVSQLNVGAAYMDGDGVKQDYRQARVWLTRSAEAGFSHAQYQLGRLYFEGLGLAPDRVQAERWLVKALAQGHPGAMNLLAEIHTGPTGVPDDANLVFDLYRAAAEHKSQSATFQLGNILRAGYLGAPDYAQAMMWYQRAAAKGFAPADLAIGELYEQGRGVAADSQRALSHYERAAGLGSYHAVKKLGEVYRDGRGGPPDLVAAAMWFTIGGKMGGGASENALQALLPRLSDAQRAMAAARANTWIVEHPAAMQQRAEQYQYQEWTLASYPSNQPPRGPSTAEERAYALQLTRKLERDPLSLGAAAGRAWLELWWSEIPDIEVRYCNLVDPPDHQPYEYAPILYQQIAFSEGAFTLENLSKPRDWQAAYLAGVNGTLRAYESILRQKQERSAWLDGLLEKRERADLPDAVRQLVAERCK